MLQWLLFLLAITSKVRDGLVYDFVVHSDVLLCARLECHHRWYGHEIILNYQCLLGTLQLATLGSNLRSSSLGSDWSLLCLLRCHSLRLEAIRLLVSRSQDYLGRWVSFQLWWLRLLHLIGRLEFCYIACRVLVERRESSLMMTLAYRDWLRRRGTSDLFALLLMSHWAWCSCSL